MSKFTKISKAKKKRIEKGPRGRFSEIGLMKIDLLLRRANIFNVRPTYSAAHYRRKFGLKKLASAVRGALIAKQRAR